jgi:pimeloyl-ACP methyl ester carboxylesterase/DNA-binding CsgD family transcriptional regulator
MAGRPPQVRYAQAERGKIAFQVIGTGPVDVVMVPGFVSHLELNWQQTSYRRFSQALARGCRLIQFDKRGTGLSDPVVDLPTIDERVDDILAVMTAARSRRALVLGLSDGARAAIALAADHPKRTIGLILYGTSYRGPRAGTLRVYRSMVRHWGEGRILDAFGPSLANAETRRAAGAFERAAASPAMAAALVESLGLLVVREQMAGLNVPTLVLHRAGDFLPLDDARTVAAQIPAAAMVVLSGSDHLPWVGDWQEVAAHILNFADEVAPRSSRSTVSNAQARSDTRTRSGQHRPLVGWAALSEAERGIVGLAVEGLTNREIAARLFLSRYTVETHLKHVFAKLGVRSRTELAALSVSQPGVPRPRNT